jgi:hypothetical protein
MGIVEENINREVRKGFFILGGFTMIPILLKVLGLLSGENVILAFMAANFGLNVVAYYYALKALKMAAPLAHSYDQAVQLANEYKKEREALIAGKARKSGLFGRFRQQ